MEISVVLNALFRWIHIVAGIVWIGLLYFFNFVNIPFAAKMKQAGASGTVVPELMPRALYWFRWGAAWTWVTGVLLLIVVFYHYHGGMMFDPVDAGWGTGAVVSLVLVFGGVFLYEALFSSPLAKNAKAANTVAFVLTAGIVLVMIYWGHFGYRAYVIHTGALFGTIMAYNVWVRIWPAQQKIIRAVKAGEAPDAAWLAVAGSRSRHNTYLSVPLIWAMINSHTTVASGSWIILLVAILVGWHVVFQLYRKSTKIEGF